MTGFSVERLRLTPEHVRAWGSADRRHRNWPVVYVMTSQRDVYVGESVNAEGRMRQHLESGQKDQLNWVRVVLGDRFNKSACLDLESYLIRLFAGDGRFQVLNGNAGIIDADYYDRAAYRKTFDDIVEALRSHEGLFQRTIPEIVNSELFKFSPFKALNQDQALAAEDILEGLFADLASGNPSTVVVQGNPGTGKTVIAIYLLKLLDDIRRHDPETPIDGESIFGDFFTPGFADLLRDLRVGIVVPQQSLRQSIRRVFAATPGLDKRSVLTPFEVGASTEQFDLLIVDEAHRLTHRANQSAGPLNAKYAEINRALFGADDPAITQLDWIRKQSRHVILLLDPQQTVRPADLPTEVTRSLLDGVARDGRLYALRSQMRIAADEDYVGYVRAVLGDDPPSTAQHFGGYDLRFFDDLGAMRREILMRNAEHGLARLVAGYAWDWRSRNDPAAFDIEIDGEQLRWNSTQRDWINSAGSEMEVGSIHTVQGYDLNYAGVIVGRDLRLDAEGLITFDRAHYRDKKGMENNLKRGIAYSDDDMLAFVRNIYAVLLTRGILGTYLYVCDPALKRHLRQYFPSSG